MRLDKEIKACLGKRVFIPEFKNGWKHLNDKCYVPAEKEVLAIIFDDGNYKAKYALDYDAVGNYMYYNEDDFHLELDSCRMACIDLTSKIEKKAETEINLKKFRNEKIMNDMWVRFAEDFINRDKE